MDGILIPNFYFYHWIIGLSYFIIEARKFKLIFQSFWTFRTEAAAAHFLSFIQSAYPHYNISCMKYKGGYD